MQTRRGTLCQIFTLLVVAALSAALLAAFSQPALAQTTDPLNFFKSYFVTGDYVVGGVGLRGQGKPDSTAAAIANDGINTSYATGAISMSGVPQNADILAAYLYWQTIEHSTTPTGSVGVFRGAKVVGLQLAPSGTLACFGSGGGGSTTNQGEYLRVYRADVLRDLAIKRADNGQPLSRRLVNDTDLQANNLGLNIISLPDSGGGGTQAPSSGNQSILTEGVSLVVVYRTTPDTYRAVVFYDGGFRFDANSGAISQTLKGFYDSSQTSHTARFTHIVGDGQLNFTEVLTFSDGTSYTNQFVGAQGQAWDNPTFSVTLTSDASSVGTSIAPASQSTTDCLSWAAMVVSTPVQDTDGDGLLDAWEKGTQLVDPNGNPLPNLPAMGAKYDRKDLFVQVGFLQTNGYTTTSQGTVPPHTHAPDATVVQMVGKAYENAPVSNPDPLAKGIKLHVDMGPFLQGTPYVIPYTHSDGSPCTGAVDDTQCLARGGNPINETSTDGSPYLPPMTEFPDYPGTIGWKVDYRLVRDQPLNYSTETDCINAGALCQRRFDRNRKDIFHYVLFGHTQARQKWLIADGSLTQVSVNSGTATVTTLEPHNMTVGQFVSVTGAAAASNLNGTYSVTAVDTNTFQFAITGANAVPTGIYNNFTLGVGNGVPRSNSGVGDLPGSDLMLTLGRWENFTGSDFIVASTWLHELGHNLDLMHGAGLGLKASASTPPPPNCKPNYESSMSYLYQVSGLLDASGGAHIDYSRAVLPSLDENALDENWLGAIVMPYKTRWYVPFSSSFVDKFLGTTVLKDRHCDGTPLSADEQAWLAQPVTPPNGMVRVDSLGLTGPTDWNADGKTDADAPQDINFNGGPNSALTTPTPTDGPFTSFTDSVQGSQFADWDVIDLRQVGGRRNVAALSLDVTLNDLAAADFAAADFAAADFAAADFAAADFAAADFAAADFAAADFGGELDLPTARAAGDRPSGLNAVGGKNVVNLSWAAPHLDANAVDHYQIWRALGPITPNNAPKKLNTVPAGTLTYMDTSVTPNKTYFYLVTAVFTGTTTRNSGPSNQAKCAFTGTSCQ